MPCYCNYMQQLLNATYSKDVVETKLAVLQVEVSKETGEVMLLIETACGLRPVMGWPDVNGLQDFAKTLLGICSDINGKDAHSMSYPTDESLDNIYDGK